MHPERLRNPGTERPRHQNQDMDSLVAAAWAAGWWCKRGGNQHMKCYPPDDGRMVPIPSTPSDRRTYRNKRSQLRRGGVTDFG